MYTVQYSFCSGDPSEMRFFVKESLSMGRPLRERTAPLMENATFFPFTVIRTRVFSSRRFVWEEVHQADTPPKTGEVKVPDVL